MTDTLTPVERTNWALSTWNSTLDRNDGPTAWLYGQDHLWTTQDLVQKPASSHQNLNSFFGQLIAVLNSYPHSMSPIARLKRSAFLRRGFTAL